MRYNFLIKSIFFLILIFIIGLPINKISDLTFLSFGLLIIISFKCRDEINLKNYFPFSAIIMIIILCFITNKKDITEFNSTFFSKADIEIIKDILPNKIIDEINIDYSKIDIKRILQSQSEEQFKSEKKFNNFNFIKKPFSYSTESYLNYNKYTRKVNKINFKTREDLKISQINTLVYNLTYDKELRRELPYYVIFKIPKKYHKSKICGKGNIFYGYYLDDKIDINNINFNKKNNSNCFKLQEKKNLYLIGYSINKTDNLEIKLSKNYLNFFLSYFSIFLITLYLVIFTKNYFIIKKFSNKELSVIIISILTSILFILIKDFNILTGLRYFRGGADGLVHENHAINIIKNLYEFNLIEALRGNEDVFYFMPGLRYFLALNKIFFGDNSYGYLIISPLLPISVFYLFKNLISEKSAFYFFILFTLIPIFENLGFGHFNYIHQIIRNHAETLSISIIVFILVKISELNFKEKLNILKSFIYCFILAFAVFCRPNFLPSSIIIFFYIFYISFNKNYISAIFAGLGYSFIFASLIHNIYFGNSLSLFTQSTVHFAFNEIFQNLNITNRENNMIFNQLIKWNPLYNIHRLIILFFVIYSFFKFKKNSILIILFLCTISQHIVLVLTHPDSRYAYLAWLLTFILFGNYLLNYYLKRFK